MACVRLFADSEIELVLDYALMGTRWQQGLRRASALAPLVHVRVGADDSDFGPGPSPRDQAGWEALYGCYSKA